MFTLRISVAQNGFKGLHKLQTTVTPALTGYIDKPHISIFNISLPSDLLANEGLSSFV